MSARDWLVKLIGRPAERSALVSEQAGPTTHFIRNPYPQEVAPGLTPQKLAAVLRESIGGSPERYLALAEDMEERFAHYGAVLAIRKRQVARLPITVDAASDDPDDKLVPLGMQVDMADVRRKLGLMAPAPGAKALGIPASFAHRGHRVTAAQDYRPPWADDYADIILSQGWEHADDAGSTGHTSRTAP